MTTTSTQPNGLQITNCERDTTEGCVPKAKKLAPSNQADEVTVAKKACGSSKYTVEQLDTPVLKFTCYKGQWT